MATYYPFIAVLLRAVPRSNRKLNLTICRLHYSQDREGGKEGVGGMATKAGRERDERERQAKSGGKFRPDSIYTTEILVSTLVYDMLARG